MTKVCIRAQRTYHQKSPDEQPDTPFRPQIAGRLPVEHRFAWLRLFGGTQESSPIIFAARTFFPKYIQNASRLVLRGLNRLLGFRRSLWSTLRELPLNNER